MERHDNVARTVADVITRQAGIPTRLEQWVPTMQRTTASGAIQNARLDVVLTLDGQPTYIDVSIVSPFSRKPDDLAAAARTPGYMAKLAERGKFNRYPGHKLIPFVLETTGRPGQQARKFIQGLFRDHPTPALAIRNAWACIQSTLHTSISLQQLKVIKGS